VNSCRLVSAQAPTDTLRHRNTAGPRQVLAVGSRTDTFHPRSSHAHYTPLRMMYTPCVFRTGSHKAARVSPGVNMPVAKWYLSCCIIIPPLAMADARIDRDAKRLW
jgi:hypothetical protein